MQKLLPATHELMIRPEKAKDLQPVRSLLVAAFSEAEDAALVERLRGSKGYIDSLTLVAEYSSEVSAFLMMSRVELQFGESSVGILAMGPVAVAPAHQGKSIGTTLVKEGIRLADERGEQLIVVLGHEDFYPRFGFQPASNFNIKPPQPWPDANYMALALSSYSDTTKGTVVYPPEWRI